ncbi:MAG: hypothetical protein M4579_001774 [Chaenotheca gracillima]|nr:MAG: hypothetical protein M4579_001774 [Chaenotheca gracillima]
MNQNFRQQLLSNLKGQTVEVRDIQSRFPGWHRGVHPEYERMRPVLDEKLQSLVKNEKKLAKLRKADFALFGASWWPYTKYEDCITLTQLAIWLFIWDDEIEEDGGSLFEDFEGAQAFREKTLKFIESSLGLGSQEAQPTPTSPIINSFQEIADRLCERYTIEQRQRFMDQMSFFIEMSEVEQQVRMSGRIPTIKEYWDIRMGTSAVGVCLAMLDFAGQMSLPTSIMKDPDMQVLWDQTNVIISLVNDMLSLKKEIVGIPFMKLLSMLDKADKDRVSQAHGQTDSLIPLLFALSSNIQQSMDVASNALRSAVINFEMAADRLTSRRSGDAKTDEDVAAYVRGCQYNLTGNLGWSLQTGRYGLNLEKQDEDSVTFTL